MPHKDIDARRKSCRDRRDRYKQDPKWMAQRARSQANYKRRQKARAEHGMRVEELDEFPERCMWHFFLRDRCLRKAFWGNGAWHACDRHRHPRDQPWTLKNSCSE